MDQLKSSVAEKLGQLEDDWVELESKRRELEEQLRRVSDSQRPLMIRRLRLRKEAGLLRDRERKMFARELASIEEIERLEAEAAAETESPVTVPESSEPGPSVDFPGELPAEFLLEGIPDDFS